MIIIDNMRAITIHNQILNKLFECIIHSHEIPLRFSASVHLIPNQGKTIKQNAVPLYLTFNLKLFRFAFILEYGIG